MAIKNRFSFTNYVQIQKWTDSTFALPFWRIKNLPDKHFPYTTINNILLFFKNIYQYHSQSRKNSCYMGKELLSILSLWLFVCLSVFTNYFFAHFLKSLYFYWFLRNPLWEFLINFLWKLKKNLELPKNFEQLFSWQILDFSRSMCIW